MGLGEHTGEAELNDLSTETERDDVFGGRDEGNGQLERDQGVGGEALEVGAAPLGVVHREEGVSTEETEDGSSAILSPREVSLHSGHNLQCCGGDWEDVSRVQTEVLAKAHGESVVADNSCYCCSATAARIDTYFDEISARVGSEEVRWHRVQRIVCHQHDQIEDSVHGKRTALMGQGSILYTGALYPRQSL